MPEIPNGPADSPGMGELAEQSVKAISSLHAAMVNFHLYPPTSDIVEDSVKRALADLQAALRSQGSTTLCELEGKLLINGICLDEKEQARPNIVALMRDLALWGVRSVTFEPGLDDVELRAFLRTFSRKRSEPSLEESLAAVLGQENVSHIKVDEKVYVSRGKNQEIAPTAGESPEDEATSMPRDETFVRYLVGNVSNIEASPAEVAAMLSDPERINAAFRSAMLGLEGFGESMTPEKARLVRDAVNRMYGLVEKVSDPEVKESLNREIIGILSALEPGTLVEVFTVASPKAVRESGMRREVISSIKGERALGLIDEVIEKYRGILTARGGMDPLEYENASAVLNEIITELYRGGDAAFHAGMTRRLRDSGLLRELAGSSPQAGKEMEIYGIVAEIRSTGSLRPLEGLSDREVIGVAGKMLDAGEKDVAGRIIAATLRNLESERHDFRVRACRFLKDMYLDLKARGYRAEIAEKSDDLIAILRRETNQEVQENLVELLGYLANDLFVNGEVEMFDRSTAVLAAAAREGGGRLAAVARAALGSLNAWDVGKPLADHLFSGEEGMRRLAARILPFMEQTPIVSEVVDHLKGEQEVAITPELAAACAEIGEPLYVALGELMEGNAREEVYLRALRLLEMMGTPAALSVVKAADGNPIPSVRAQAVRSMARLAPGDASLLPHFMRALEDEDVEVRREGARGLGAIDDPRCVDVLVGIIQGRAPSGKEENPRVEEAACLALARLGPEKALAPLQDLLRKKSFALRKRAVHSRVKAAACYALGEIGGPESVELVRGYLDDPDPILRNEARKALGVLRKRGYAP